MNLPLFTESKLCASGKVCRQCRDADRAPVFHANWRRIYSMPDGWQCPKGLPMVSYPRIEKTRTRNKPPARPPVVRPDPPAKPTIVPITVRRTHNGMLIEEPPPATEKQVATYLKALASAKRVPLEVVQEREATCAGCEYVRWSEESGAPWCSRCGCKVGGQASAFLRWMLKKLTEVEENLPAWGCHHPQRSKGMGWKR